MIRMRLDEIATAVGGRITDGAPDLEVTGPATLDSRDVPAGGLFVAMAGERADGHDFAAGAVAAGAAAVLGSRPTGVPSVVVEDVPYALGLLARHLLDRLPGLTVLALTGSQGKTSTKDLLAQVLATHGPTVATRGNHNNELGVPLTVLRADETTAYLVLEMGARGVGHLAYLCSFARPRVAAVLNVGSAHLGEFGTRDDIARAKGELVEALGPEGVAVLNADDPLVAAMADRTAARVRSFGTDGSADLRVQDLTTDDLGRPRFTLVERTAAGEESAAVALRTIGLHQAGNAAAAAALARAVGMPLAAVAAALSAAGTASPWRMELTETAGVTILNDVYNANPESMRAALATLTDIGRRRPGSRTVAVLGVMRELGRGSEAAHEALGRHAAESGVDRLVVVGEEADGIARGASAVPGGAERTVRVEDRAQALAWVRENVAAPDVVLVKASRGAALEQVVDGLVEHLSAPSTTAPEENR